ncbi:hypothetical protein Q4508_08575 [Amphritea sp. 2_MG-2023]|jgi:hypothetical protein|uniref:hypothetical protein n=1 Tax=Amphritea TaxID=515417 RepID=UPI001C0760FD|nr:MULTISPECIES: hypothetical protein [Amphritea]MBU2965454.1 hypothetical protein [Amphritea atlantica]MDO6418610.1 hypothetical protein [Amphritea sp. 2_MG-2023]MDX2423090.1 hypothetical protein [Amphritea sp.]
MIIAMPELTPVLKADCQLYFDGQHNRWVLKAPQQLVFPDRLSLMTLQACDGYCSGAQIARSLATFDDLNNVTEFDVLDVLEEFERRGFIAVMMA